MNKREDIVGAIKTRMQLILVSGGYLTNFGQYVQIWKRLPLDFNGTLLNIRDTADDFGKEHLHAAVNEQQHRLTVQIDLLNAEKGQAAAAYLRKGLSDVYKAFGVDDTLGLSYVIQCNPLSDTFDVEQDERIVVSGTIVIEVQYQTTKWEN
jgi:hypothetical protein